MCQVLFFATSLSYQFHHTLSRRRTKLQFYNLLNTSLSAKGCCSPVTTPCLVSTVDFGAHIAASAANYHFPCEAAAVTSSVGGRNKLWIWDFERGEVDAYLRAFDDEECASSWAECIWGHHPRSIFCLGPRRMNMVDLRSAAVSSAIDIGSAGFLPSGRFHGAHSPCDSRVPMIVTTSSSAVSLWDLRFLREPVVQWLHHLEHDPPSFIATSIRNCSRDVFGRDTVDDRLLMDVLVCGSCFSHPLLHSINLGNEFSPVKVGLPQSIYGLRHAHQLHHSARALHPDGAQSASATTSGMCSLSNSLPEGIQFIAFFASLNGDIWLSYAVNDGNGAVELGSAASAELSSSGFAINRRIVVPFQAASDEVDTKLSSRFLVNANSQLPPLPSELMNWMALPRTSPSSSFLFHVFSFYLSGTVDEIVAFLGHSVISHLSSSHLLSILPSCRLWRLGLSGTWQSLADSDSSSTSLTVFDILCATEGSPPVIFLPSHHTPSLLMPDSMASSVDTAFSRNAVAAAPLPEPAKSQPILSATQLFGSPLRASQFQHSQPHVRFKDVNRDSGFASSSPSQLQSDHRRTTFAPAAPAHPAVLTSALKLESAIPHTAPGSESLFNPPQNVSGVWSSKRGGTGAASGPKRRSSEGF